MWFVVRVVSTMTTLSKRAVARFWRGMYNRFENGVHPREPLSDILAATKDHILSLEDHIQHLVKRIAQLRELLHHADTPSKDLDSVLGESLTGDELDSQPASSEGAVSVRDSGFGDADYNECKELQQKLHQHKLGDSFGSTVLQKLMEEFDSVAVDWKSFRNIKECPCSTPFDHFRRKFHCWSCGDVFCIRCIDKRLCLPGHMTKRPVPVCRHCYKELTHTNSIDS